MYSKILIGFDGSDVSASALEAGIDLARKYNSEILLVSIIERIIIPSPDGAILPLVDVMSTISKEVRKMASDKLQELEKKYPAITFHSMVKEGRPSQTIVKIATQELADLIVLGHCGHRGIVERLMGSTSQYISNHAPCSVLIVR